jgi:hypothetical protein
MRRAADAGALTRKELLPLGHDAWSVGDQPCTFVEFSRGNGYYG